MFNIEDPLRILWEQNFPTADVGITWGIDSFFQAEQDLANPILKKILRNFSEAETWYMTQNKQQISICGIMDPLDIEYLEISKKFLEIRKFPAQNIKIQNILLWLVCRNV